jgi:hypothetical protein
MKFAEFLLNEEIALGDMGTKIDQLFKNQNFQNQSGAYLSSDWTGSGGYQSPTNSPLRLPGTDLTIPTIEKSGRITVLLSKRNPIYVCLSDGTEANFTYEEWKRIKGEPALGKVMHITFQRHPEDKSAQHSKIDHVTVD